MQHEPIKIFYLPRDPFINAQRVDANDAMMGAGLIYLVEAL